MEEQSAPAPKLLYNVVEIATMLRIRQKQALSIHP